MATSIQKFFSKDSTAGIMLLGATLAALLGAYGPLNEIYHSLLELEFTFGFPSLHIEEAVLEWINDGYLFSACRPGDQK